MPPVDVLQRVHEVVASAMACGPCPEPFTEQWLALADDDPRRQAALLRAAFGRWVDSQIEREQTARAKADASRAVQAADPALWKRVAADRRRCVPRQRARSVYPGGAQ